MVAGPGLVDPPAATARLPKGRWYAVAMPFGIGIPELLILLLVLLLVFGPKRLPEMGRQLGKGMREFKESVSGKDDDPVDDMNPANPTKPGGGGGSATDGKTVFATAGCTGCHTLKAAGSSGTVGPNLDEAKPSKALVIDRVTNGLGGMPSFKGQLSEAQIQAVADYVSSNAGK